MTTVSLEEQIRLLEDSINYPVEDMPAQPVRSGYLGVYLNKGKNKDKFAFRAAICLFKGQPNQRWINLGYFNCEHVAASAYNVASANYFKGNGMLNPVKSELANQQEQDEFNEKRQGYVLKAAAVIGAKLQAGESLKYWELREQA